MTNNSILTAITGVFDAVGDWIVSAVGDMTALFYSSSDGLTLLGTLAVCGLAFSVIFLIIGIIQNFLHFRG